MIPKAIRQRPGRYSNVEAYITARAILPKYFYDGFDLKKLANACNIRISEVRAQLHTLGYEPEVNQKGLKMWRLPYDKVQSLRK